MFKVYEMMGNFSKEVGMFEDLYDAEEYISYRWDEAKDEAIMFHSDDELGEEDIMQEFYSYFSIEDDGRELISIDDITKMYDEMLDECYPSMFGMSASIILCRADKIQYDIGLSDFYDSISDQYYCEEME